MEGPSRRRRLAAVAVDVAVLTLAAPLVAALVGVGLSTLAYAATVGDCVSPCDGPGMAGFSIALLALMLVWALYWPVLIYWRRRTLGSMLMGLKFSGSGLRRHLVDATASE